MEGYLLYNVVLVFATHQHERAKGIHFFLCISVYMFFVYYLCEVKVLVAQSCPTLL